ncbi:uncharacterized protein METZ01_LOCUS332103 [marine metagenome]|uniref:Helix-turn-helix domain-containing protein n=1 Tax=marine metagenome TaxID=408172 RepID=A0A382Q119_9ZZZZ
MINCYLKVDPFQDKSNKKIKMFKEKDKLEALSARLMSIEDAAVLMKIKKGTLQNWLSKGYKFKRVKVGGRTFIDGLELEAYLQAALTGR